MSPARFLLRQRSIELDRFATTLGDGYAELVIRSAIGGHRIAAVVDDNAICLERPGCTGRYRHLVTFAIEPNRALVEIGEFSTFNYELLRADLDFAVR